MEIKNMGSLILQRDGVFVHESLVPIQTKKKGEHMSGGHGGGGFSPPDFAVKAFWIVIVAGIAYFFILAAPWAIRGAITNGRCAIDPASAECQTSSAYEANSLGSPGYVVRQNGPQRPLTVGNRDSRCQPCRPGYFHSPRPGAPCGCGR